jgi:hypothetical protein
LCRALLFLMRWYMSSWFCCLLDQLFSQRNNRGTCTSLNPKKKKKNKANRKS